MAADKVVMLYDDQFTASISPIDIHNKPAKVDGVPEWASSDSNVAAVTPAADGMSVVVKGVNPGTAQLSVSADADLGVGTVTITGTLDLQVDSLQAVGFTVSAGPLSKQ